MTFDEGIKQTSKDGLHLYDPQTENRWFKGLGVRGKVFCFYSGKTKSISINQNTIDKTHSRYELRNFIPEVKPNDTVKYVCLDGRIVRCKVIRKTRTGTLDLLFDNGTIKENVSHSINLDYLFWSTVDTK
jgi:hypothetical protein